MKEQRYANVKYKTIISENVREGNSQVKNTEEMWVKIKKTKSHEKIPKWSNSQTKNHGDKKEIR